MTEESPSCIFCASTKTIRAFPVTDIFDVTRELRRCEQCGAWFYWPGPSGEELTQAYSDDYYGRHDTKFRWGAIETIVEWFRKGRARMLRRYLGHSGVVLDIGCGNGNMLHQLSAMGLFRLHGTEMPGNSALRAANHPEISLFTGSFFSAPYTPAQFDAITLFHVLEHLPEPLAHLDRIDELLKPGGLLVLSFPNNRSWQARFFGPHWLHLDPPRHLFLPDYRDLSARLAAKGYIRLRRSFFSPEQNPVGAVQSLLNRYSSVRDLLLERLKGNMSYHPEVGPWLMFWQKVFFITTMPFFIFTDIVASTAGYGATVLLIFKKGNPDV